MTVGDVALPMGVLLTAAVFLAGASSARIESVLGRLDADLARLLDWTGSVGPGDMAADRTVPNVRAGLTITVGGALYFANLALAATFVWSRPGSWQLLVVIGVHLAVHTLVLGWTVSEAADGRRRYDAQRERSAPFVLLGTFGFTVPEKGSPGRLPRTTEMVERRRLALAAVPAGVADGTYRRHLADAQEELAEVLLDESQPRAALAQLDAADATRREGWAPGWLAGQGEHSTEQFIDTLVATARWLLRARALHELGEYAEELDARLQATRYDRGSLSEAAALLRAARLSGRVPELTALLVPDAGAHTPAWRASLRTWVGAAIDDQHGTLVGEPPETMSLDELRLLCAVRADTRGAGRYAAVLARRLVEEALRPPVDPRSVLLMEAERLIPGVPTGTYRHDWRRARAALLTATGRHDELVDVLLEALHDPTLGTAQVVAGVAVRAGIAQRLVDALRAEADGLDANDPQDRRHRRRLGIRLDELNEAVARATAEAAPEERTHAEDASSPR